MALPLRLVWGLRIDRTRKIGLAGIFLLGLVDIIFAIVRVIETSASAHHVDVVWLGFWSMIEASVGVLPLASAKLRDLQRLMQSDAFRDHRIMLAVL